MKKFEITEEQIKTLENDGINYIKEWFPEVFETKLQVGKWYRNVDYNGGEMIACVSEIHETQVWDFKGYGFGVSGKWYKGKFGAKNWQLATEEEVKSALIKEAERRGFVNGVYGNNSMIEFNGCIPDVSKRCKLDFKLGYAPFEQYNDLRIKGTTPCNSAFIIFKNGVWAEVIKPKYYTKAQAEKRLTELENDGYEYEIID